MKSTLDNIIKTELDWTSEILNLPIQQRAVEVVAFIFTLYSKAMLQVFFEVFEVPLFEILENNLFLIECEFVLTVIDTLSLAFCWINYNSCVY